MGIVLEVLKEHEGVHLLFSLIEDPALAQNPGILVKQIEPLWFDSCGTMGPSTVTPVSVILHLVAHTQVILALEEVINV